jgi:hypothetical protein
MYSVSSIDGKLEENTKLDSAMHKISAAEFSRQLFAFRIPDDSSGTCNSASADR